MQKLPAFVVVFALSCLFGEPAISASAQQEAFPWAQKTPQAAPSTRYTVEQQPDGSLKVVPAPDASTGAGMLDALTGKQAIFDMLKQQEFWLATNPDGALNTIFVVPKGEAPPEKALANVPDGTTFAKVSGSTALGSILPSTDDMAEILSGLMTSAKNAVCAMPTRPTQFGTVVDISAGFGVQGRVEFNATWNTSDLCAP